MNRYNMLTQIREDIRHDKISTRNYKRFVLTGVIVHDINDVDLINCISKNFVKWAEDTGENFLFITFIQPSTDWKNSKFCREPFWIDPNILMTDHRLSSEDVERTNPLLRDMMGLPSEGSYMVLTEDLGSNNIHHFPISPDSIENQFNILKKYCDDEASGIIHNPKEYKQLLRQLKADETAHLQSLLDSLIEYTSLISNFVDNGITIQKQQIKKANDVIRKLKNNLSCYNGVDFEDRVFHLYESLDVFLQKIYSQNIRSILFDKYKQFLENNMLDAYSRKLLGSYLLLEKYTARYVEKIDYSGLTIYIGKIVENELNLSIEQMLRHAMGIEMPRYYNKYCLKKRSVKIPAGTINIDVNQSLSYSNRKDLAPLKSIPMGNLMFAYKDMLDPPSTANYPVEPQKKRLQRLADSTIEFFEDFSKNYRNPAAHLDPKSDITYKGAEQALQEFLDLYLNELYSIKKKTLKCRIETTQVL